MLHYIRCYRIVPETKPAFTLGLGLGVFRNMLSIPLLAVLL